MSETLQDTPEAPAPPIPANFVRGAKPTWHQKRRHRALLGLLRKVPGGEVLDYGCGYGDLTYAIARTHPNVRGVDVGPERVAFAAREYAPIPFGMCGEAGVDFPDESFDIVMSSVVIPFVPDPAGYLSECCRVLRPGGHLILACRNVDHVRNALRRLVGKGPAPARVWVRTRTEVRPMLDARGFDVLDETYFYDPPFGSWKNAGDVLTGSIEQVLSLLRVAETSGYFAFLARKRP